MPRGPNGQQRPVDGVGCAVKVARIVTGELEDSLVGAGPKQARGRAGSVLWVLPLDSAPSSRSRPRRHGGERVASKRKKILRTVFFSVEGTANRYEELFLR